MEVEEVQLLHLVPTCFRPWQATSALSNRNRNITSSTSNRHTSMALSMDSEEVVYIEILSGWIELMLLDVVVGLLGSFLFCSYRG